MTDSLPSIPRTAEDWRMASQAVTGGPSVVGTQQFVAGPSGRWTARLSLLCRLPQHYLDIRGFLLGLDGPSTPFYAGPIDWRNIPWNIHPLTGAVITPALAKKAYQADTGYSANPMSNPAITFNLSSAAAVNARQINIARTRGGLLKPGMYFSVGDRLHAIVRMITPDDGGPGPFTAEIRPWLRAPVAAGTGLLFSAPRGLMRLASTDYPLPEMRADSPNSAFALDIVEYF